MFWKRRTLQLKNMNQESANLEPQSSKSSNNKQNNCFFFVRKFFYLKLFHQRHYQYRLQFLSFISLKGILRVCEWIYGNSWTHKNSCKVSGKTCNKKRQLLRKSFELLKQKNNIGRLIAHKDITEVDFTDYLDYVLPHNQKISSHCWR